MHTKSLWRFTCYTPPTCVFALHVAFSWHNSSCFLWNRLWSCLHITLRLNRCLKKTYPKDLPTLGVVLIYLDEALSIIKRALRSIIDRTPKNLLKEIIMVDDNSSNGWLLANNARSPHMLFKGHMDFWDSEQAASGWVWSWRCQLLFKSGFKVKISSNHHKRSFIFFQFY